MALSFGKSRPPSETQIQRHRDQLSTRNQWSNDVDSVKAISLRLREAYKSHKGDFALGRYEELKDMIKGSIKDYQMLMEKTQKQSRGDAASAIASKYSGGGGGCSKQSSQQAAPPAPSGKSSGGLFSRLKNSASNFTSSASKDSREGQMATWGYEGMNAKQVTEETESMRKEVLQLKVDFRTERDRLERMSKEYEDSKKHLPPQRYTVLKYLIKDATQ